MRREVKERKARGGKEHCNAHVRALACVWHSMYVYCTPKHLAVNWKRALQEEIHCGVVDYRYDYANLGVEQCRMDSPRAIMRGLLEAFIHKTKKCG